jgi:hypothetical protein
VNFLTEYSLPILIILVIILLISFGMICLLLYPLIADLAPVNNLVLVGVTPGSRTPSLRKQQSLRSKSKNSGSVKFIEDKQSTIFIVSGGGGEGSSTPNKGQFERKDSISIPMTPREIRRSRSGSIVSFM